MLTEGIHDISADEYHRDPCEQPSLSSSIARVLLNQTPRHAYFGHPRLNPGFEPEHDPKFDIGTAAHALMLGDVQNFAIFPGDTWNAHKSKAAMAAKRDAREAGKIPLLEDQFRRVQTMVEIGRVQLAERRDDAFTDGKPEQTVVWQEGGLWFRIRLDWLHDSVLRERFGPARNWNFDDYKTTTTADPSAWARIAVSIGHDIQAAFYRRGIRALGLAKDPVMRFVVQETEPPYALCVMRMSDAMLELADRQVERAIAIWRKCLATNDWPGYPPYTVEIEAPGWHEERVLSREIAQDGQERRWSVNWQKLHELAHEAQRP